MAKREGYPFYILFGKKPEEGKRRTYEVITTNEEATNSTQAAEVLMNKLVKEKRVEIGEGDHLCVAQITRVRGLKPIRKIAQVDMDPSEVFGDVGTAPSAIVEEPVEVEDGKVSEAEDGAGGVEIPDAPKPPAAPASQPPAAAKKPPAKKPVPAAPMPPPEAVAAEEDMSLEESDPLADMGESKGDVVKTEPEPITKAPASKAPANKKPVEKAPVAPVEPVTEEGTEEAQATEDPLADIF